MTLEAAGFAPGNRELRQVYAQRITAFPEGSLMACLGPQCIGCLFSEIWRAVPKPGPEHFRLGHGILERHDPAQGTELYISSMTIDPAFRGLGLGMPLFAGCIDRLAKAFPQLTSTLLLVNASWSRAIGIYRAAGFREIARFKEFFHPSGNRCEDGLVMRRPMA
jgi:ribosomal protein S18 acetylase RimI-like enzyme